MPAVDLERLARQIEAVVAVGTDPHAVARGCLDLLEFYRDRSRHSPVAQRAAARAAAFGAPRPVVRALAQALRQAVRDRPQEALALAASLWQHEARETRSLAIMLLSVVSGDEAAAWAEPRAAACDDFDLLDDLAASGLGRLRREHPQAFLQSAGRWLKADSARLRAMALLSLRAAAEAPNTEAVPAIFHLLPHGLTGHRGISRKALLRLLETLARRSPQETARLVLDHLRSGGVEGAALLQDLLPAFPPSQQARLRKALAELRAPGIMRRTL